MSSPDEDEAPEGWIEALVAATAEFLPGVGVIPLVAINKAWRDGARTALFRGRWRPVFETLKIIKADEGPPPGWDRRPADRDAAATALFKEAWRLDGSLTLKVITEGDVQCARTAAADFLGVTFRARLVRRGQSDPEAKERCILETSC